LMSIRCKLHGVGKRKTQFSDCFGNFQVAGLYVNSFCIVRGLAADGSTRSPFWIKLTPPGICFGIGVLDKRDIYARKNRKNLNCVYGQNKVHGFGFLALFNEWATIQKREKKQVGAENQSFGF
jgi:hypothetical protein